MYSYDVSSVFLYHQTFWIFNKFGDLQHRLVGDTLWLSIFVFNIHVVILTLGPGPGNAAGMDELLERIPVGQLIGLELADSEDLIELVISTAKNFDANLKELDDCLGSKDDKARWGLIQKTDLPVLPLSDTLIYRYDYGDDWTVTITVVEEVEGELKDQVLEMERPICVAADGLPVMDDVGGIRGYCELIKVVKGKEESEVSAFESKEDAKDWARMMGWTGRMSKAENIL